MERYSPLFLGKIMPSPENPSKLTNFLSEKYDAFTKIFDACKDQAERINTIETISYEDGLMVKLVTDLETIKQISTASGSDPNFSVNDTGILKVGDVKK